MKNSINLIDYKGRTSTDNHNQKQKLLRKIAVGLLFIVSTTSVIFFILITFSPLPQLKKQTDKSSFTLSLANDNIIKQAIVKQRLGNIKTILSERSAYAELVEYLQIRLPSGVVILALSINNDNLTVTLGSNSLLAIDSFLEKITNKDVTRKFSKVNLVSLINSENSFIMKLTLNTL